MAIDRSKLKPTILSLGQQINMLMTQLEGLRTHKGDPRYEKMIDWLKNFPEHARPDAVYDVIAKAFGVTADDVRKSVNPRHERRSFEPLVPKTGWIADYVRYTRTTEPPTVFHFFVGATILGATLRRNIHFERGDSKIYPNLCVILVAPSGKCRKTTACELGVRLYRDLGGIVLADKITPEALVQAFAEREESTGLIFAGELKQFLGSQKYMEGMIPLLTRLFDCPEIWSSATIMREEVVLRNVALSMLGASTMDWLRMLPGDAFGGGFMSRNLLVVQEETERSFPLPPPLSETLRIKLMNRLIPLTHVRARMHMSFGAEEWYIDWYNSPDTGASEEKQFSGYFERKPTHLMRLAMILSISEDESFVIERRHMEHALRILDWIEEWLPAAFEQLGSNPIGEEQMRMIQQLKRAGGTIKHSDWLRKNSSRMTAQAFKSYVATMREAKLIDIDGSAYYLTPEGWKR